MRNRHILVWLSKSPRKSAILPCSPGIRGPVEQTLLQHNTGSLSFLHGFHMWKPIGSLQRHTWFYSQYFFMGTRNRTVQLHARGRNWSTVHCIIVSSQNKCPDGSFVFVLLSEWEVDPSACVVLGCLQSPLSETQWGLVDERRRRNLHHTGFTRQRLWKP